LSGLFGPPYEKVGKAIFLIICLHTSATICFPPWLPRLRTY